MNDDHQTDDTSTNDMIIPEDGVPAPFEENDEDGTINDPNDMNEISAKHTDETPEAPDPEGPADPTATNGSV